MSQAPSPQQAARLTITSIARLYAAKGRPAFNPLIAHVGDIEAARRIARFDATATALAQAFWPGPLTLVLPVAATCRVSLLARAGLETVALRSPPKAATFCRTQRRAAFWSSKP